MIDFLKKGSDLWGELKKSLPTKDILKNMVDIMYDVSKHMLLKSKYNITKSKMNLFNLRNIIEVYIIWL